MEENEPKNLNHIIREHSDDNKNEMLINNRNNCVNNFPGKWSIPKGILLSAHRKKKQLLTAATTTTTTTNTNTTTTNILKNEQQLLAEKQLLGEKQQQQQWEQQRSQNFNVAGPGPFEDQHQHHNKNYQQLFERGNNNNNNSSSLTFARLFTTKNAQDLLIHHNLVWKFPSACEEFSKFIDNFLFSLLFELDKLKQVKHSLRKISQSDVEYVLKNRFGMTFENSRSPLSSKQKQFQQIQQQQLLAEKQQLLAEKQQLYHHDQQQQQQQIPERKIDPGSCQNVFQSNEKKISVINVAFLKILNEVFYPRSWKISKGAMSTIKMATEKLVVRALEMLSRSTNECAVTSSCVKKWCYGLFSPQNPISLN